MFRNRLTRRVFLRASGVAIALPTLDSALQNKCFGSKPEATLNPQGNQSPRRMLAICAPLGIHTPFLFPAEVGKDYMATKYLQPLQPVRDKFSVLSGLHHPMVDGGHDAEKSFLTGAAHPGLPSFRNTISVDQYAAERIGHLTRFPSLTLSANSGSISYTRSGVQIPAESRPSRVFKRLFLEGSAEEKESQMRRIKDGQSILDLVGDQLETIQNRSSREGQQTLDQYSTSVREFEKRLVLSETWAAREKPEVDREVPTDIEDRADFTGRMELMFDLIFLALQTDSTRLITLKGAGGNERVNLRGVEDGWHNLSHHGKDPVKIEQLSIIELEEMRLFGEFLAKLESVTEGEQTLLDQTAILLGSNLGNASSHNNTNLPIVVAGGQFSHGQHLSFGEQATPPLSKLLVSFLQHLGIETDEFSVGRGTLNGMEPLA